LNRINRAALVPFLAVAVPSPALATAAVAILEIHVMGPKPERDGR
jgi:hypothetical protein